jgi:hypothetical protein
MVDYAALRTDSAALIGKPVTAAALFVIDIGWAAPLAGGMAGSVAADAATDALGIGNPLVDGLAAGAGLAAGRHAVYQGSADAAGLTPVMVLATTSDEFVLMDWDGNVRSGTGPTTVFARFSRADAAVTSTRSGTTHHVELAQDGVTAKIQCTLGLLSPGKAETHQVLTELGAA